MKNKLIMTPQEYNLKSRVLVYAFIGSFVVMALLAFLNIFLSSLMFFVILSPIAFMTYSTMRDKKIMTQIENEMKESKLILSTDGSVRIKDGESTQVLYVFTDQDQTYQSLIQNVLKNEPKILKVESSLHKILEPVEENSGLQ